MSMQTALIPSDAQAAIDGSYYKIGLHGRPYRYNGEEWVRSNKEKHEVLKEIDLQKDKIKAL